MIKDYLRTYFCHIKLQKKESIVQVLVLRNITLFF